VSGGWSLLSLGRWGVFFCTTYGVRQLQVLVCVFLDEDRKLLVLTVVVVEWIVYYSWDLLCFGSLPSLSPNLSEGDFHNLLSWGVLLACYINHFPFFFFLFSFLTAYTTTTWRLHVFSLSCFLSFFLTDSCEFVSPFEHWAHST